MQAIYEQLLQSFNLNAWSSKKVPSSFKTFRELTGKSTNNCIKRSYIGKKVAPFFWKKEIIESC
jgi:hypothetical protein